MAIENRQPLSKAQRKFLREMLTLEIDINPCRNTRNGYAIGANLYPDHVVKPLMDIGIVVVESNYYDQPVIDINSPTQVRRVLRYGLQEA